MELTLTYTKKRLICIEARLAAEQPHLYEALKPSELATDQRVALLVSLEGLHLKYAIPASTMNRVRKDDTDWRHEIATPPVPGSIVPAIVARARPEIALLVDSEAGRENVRALVAMALRAIRLTECQ